MDSSKIMDILQKKYPSPKTTLNKMRSKPFAFNKETIPVDTNVHRIVNRIGWLKTKNPNETQIELEKILPKKYWKEFNSICMQHGREICKPIKPDCKNCPIKNYCKKIIN